MELGGVYINSFFVLKWDKHWPQWKILQLEATCERNKRSHEIWRNKPGDVTNEFSKITTLSRSGNETWQWKIPNVVRWSFHSNPRKLKRWTEMNRDELMICLSVCWSKLHFSDFQKAQHYQERELSKNGGPQVVVVMSKFIRRSNPIS